MVAYHFPPLGGSSGVQRALRFSAHLHDFGWEPIVLTAHTRAYEQLDSGLLSEIRPGMPVIRAQAWDTKRHLSLRGRYPEFMARPDRWRWWWFGAVPAGLLAVRRYAPAAIWSTYPIATAHSIGASLARMTGLPFVADFRDPMAQENYPRDPRTRKSFAAIERRTVSAARRCTFTAHGALAMYQGRYPQYRDRFRLLENGYDEKGFSSPILSAALNPGRLTLLHSGAVYPSERDPTRLFAALELLRTRAPESYRRIIVRFRAPVHDDLLRTLADRHRVLDAIEILPSVTYNEAIDEIRQADGLLVLQARGCNAQIPAKFYEYLGAGRPMVVLAEPAGDTAMSAASAGISAIAALEDAEGIFEVLARFGSNPSSGTVATAGARNGASRRSRTAELAALLDEAADG